MNRRQLLTLATAGCTVTPSTVTGQAASTTAAPDIAPLLRRGACAVMLRHTQTEPGIGDPPGYRLDQCSTQRNLSDKGRAQARQIGEWFKANALRPRSIQSSIWCRCKETAELGFGQFVVLGALNSTFDNRSSQEGQTEELRARLNNIPAGQFEVWVTHQVNITALTGEVSAMGEAILTSSKARMLGRTFFAL